MEYTLRTSTLVDAPPADVFGRITDIDGLPTWNAEIARILERPATLQPGAEWVVEIRAMHTHWNSRAQLIDIDPARGQVAYRSATDDGNPSHADWRWEVTDEPGRPGRSRVHVSVDIRPRTFWRRLLLSRLRRPSLQRAMERSLQALQATTTATTDAKGAR